MAAIFRTPTVCSFCFVCQSQNMGGTGHWFIKLLRRGWDIEESSGSIHIFKSTTAFNCRDFVVQFCLLFWQFRLKNHFIIWTSIAQGQRNSNLISHFYRSHFSLFWASNSQVISSQGITSIKMTTKKKKAGQTPLNLWALCKQSNLEGSHNSHFVKVRCKEKLKCTWKSIVAAYWFNNYWIIIQLGNFHYFLFQQWLDH